MQTSSKRTAPLRALFLIENMPFRYDSRVRREVDALQQTGVTVTVICPSDKNDNRRRYVENGTVVYQYSVNTNSSGVIGHVQEYLISFIWHSYLTAKVFLSTGFDVIHVGNPPDILWLVALPYKLLGRKFIYDHHDQVPELFDVRFGQSRMILRTAVRLLEKASFRLADHVIAINETCRKLAIDRGGRESKDVTVVRNGPRLSDFPSVPPDTATQALGNHIIGFVGEINPQDNVDVLIDVARILILKRKRTDIGFVIIGSGTAWDDVKRYRDEFDLARKVLMPGRVPWRDVLAMLGACTVCVQPDLPNSFTHIATMNKLMEYMALGKPVVSFDLRETRESGGDAVLYAQEASAESLANALEQVIDNPYLADSLGSNGRERVLRQLSWNHQEGALLSVYQNLFPDRFVKSHPEYSSS